MDATTALMAKSSPPWKSFSSRLYVTQFETRPDPIASANEFAEVLRESEARNCNPHLPQDVALLGSEFLNQFLDRVTEKLRRRQTPQ